MVLGRPVRTVYNNQVLAGQVRDNGYDSDEEPLAAQAILQYPPSDDDVDSTADYDDFCPDDPTDDEVEDDEVIPKPADRLPSRCRKRKRGTNVKENSNFVQTTPVAAESDKTPFEDKTNRPAEDASASTTEVLGPGGIPRTRIIPFEEVTVVGNLWVCPCKKSFKTYNGVKKHLDNIHSNLPPKFQCKICSQKFYVKSALKAHETRNFCHRDWNPDRVRVKTGLEKNPIYEGGPRKDFSANSPTEIFLFFIRAILPIWMLHTEKNGRQKFASREKKEPWRLFNLPAALRWIGLFQARGVLKQHRINDPWRLNMLFRNPIFGKAMAGYVWYQILRATGFTDREEETKEGHRGDTKSPKHMRLWRVHDVITIFTTACQAAYNPFREICIDEMMTKFVGWFQWKQTIPHKPIKSGIKSFVLACSRTGYILGFIPAVKQPFKLFSELGATGSAVWALLTSELLSNGRNFLNRGHILFTDSYYTMLRLIEKLLDVGTYYVGTIGVARQLPPGFAETSVVENGKNRKMIRGEFKQTHTKNMTLTNWLDNGAVRVASSVPDVVEEYGYVERKVKNEETDKWEKHEIPCPDIIKSYNKYMGGVDLADQLLASTNVHIRQVRWFIPIWFRILEMAMVNAYIIYQLTFPKGRFVKNRIGFHVNVIEGLLALADEIDGKDSNNDLYVDEIEQFLDGAPITQPYTLQTLKTNGRVKVAIDKIRLSNKHRHLPNAVSRGHCVIHGYTKPRIRTRIACRSCKVRLCVPKCYDKWHRCAKLSVD